MPVGYGMWTPRAHIEFDFLNLLHEAPNGYRPPFLERNIYDGFDFLPLAQELADEDVDVHAIAIATSNPPPDIDHSWIEDGDDSSSGTKNNNVPCFELPKVIAIYLYRYGTC